MNAVARLDQPFFRRQRGIRSCFIIGRSLRVVTLLGTIRHPGALPVLLPPSILLYSVSKARSAPGAQLMIISCMCILADTQYFYLFVFHICIRIQILEYTHITHIS